MNRRFSLTIPLLCFAALAWGGAAYLQPKINLLRQQEKLTYNVSDKNLPPEMALVAVLGSFRGWFINYLWLRATELEEREEYHEALILTEWITKLQPHFERVWFFQAHNMTTNIANSCGTKEERWGWTKEGIRLLREGIEVNPFSSRLHQDLASLFSNQVENRYNRTHWYASQEFAREWQRLLGAPPQGGAAERAAWLAAMRNAPTGSDRQVVDALTLLDPALGEKLTALAREGHPFNSGFCDRFVDLAGEHGVGVPDATATEQWFQLAEARSQRELLLAAARARLIREVQRMDPALMADLTRFFGPLDWRHPAAHSIYWMAQGTLRESVRELSVKWPVAYALANATDDELSRLGGAPSRLLFAPIVRPALNTLLGAGRIEYHADGDYFVRHPEPGFAPALEKVLFLMDSTEWAKEFMPNLRRSYRESLEIAAETSYCFGEDAEANFFLNRLAHYFVRRENGEPYAPQVPAMVAGSVEDLIEEVRLDEKSPDVQGKSGGEKENLLIASKREAALFYLFARLRRAFTDGFGNDRPEVARNFRDLANYLQGDLARRGLLPEPSPQRMEEYLAQALADTLREPSGMVDPFVKKRIWNQPALDVNLRRAVYPMVRESVENDLRQEGLDPMIWFQPPGGL